jgi:hypothetical protein
MNKAFGVVAALAIICMLTVSPVAVSAKHIIHLEVTVAPGTTYQDPQDLHSGEVLSCSWTTDHPVNFFLTDPIGVTIRHSNGTSGQAIVEVAATGTYTFNWQNNGDEPVSLIFDKGFLLGEQPSMLWMVALAIIIALIALVLAVVVYMSMRTKPKK